MRIVLVNWAKIWDGAGYGGGVNGYCQALALALRERGHEVASLCGGTVFVPSPTPERTRPCFIRRHEDWLGVKVFEVINSPVMAPSIVQFQDPLGEVSSPELEGEVGRLFALLRPDVVHFNNVEGFSVGCVERARAAGARVVFSLHNYHTICPQVYLMQGHRRVCHDSENGHACAGCIRTRPPEIERAARARNFEKKVVEKDEAGASASWLRKEVRGAWGGFKHEFSWPVRVLKRARELLVLRREVRERERAAGGVHPDLPGRTVASRADVDRAMPVTERPKKMKRPEEEAHEDRVGVEEIDCPDDRGQTRSIMREATWTPRVFDMEKPERRPLVNLAVADPPSEREPNEYGRRRAAMVKMLSGCDRVLAVSEFVRRKFVAMGVEEGVIATLPIGSRINRVVERGREMAFAPPVFVEPGVGAAREEAAGAQRAVRLVFMGYNNYYKGLHVLAEALELLTPEYLRRVDLAVFALDGQSIEWMFRRMEPRLARLSFVCGYNYQDIPWMCGGRDLGVVPSVWWDNAPQTVFEFFACGVPVLGAAAGGIPDFVRHGENGVLFRGNDPFDLARRLAEVLREPWVLNRLRAGVRPPKGIGAHAEEMERVYAGEDVREVDREKKVGWKAEPRLMVAGDGG